MIRLNSGDEILFSAKANDRVIKDSEFLNLLDKFKKGYAKFDPEDILYFTIRCNFNNSKSNYKCDTFNETCDMINTIRLSFQP